MPTTPPPIARAEHSLEGLSVGDAFGEQLLTHPAHFIDKRKLPPPPWACTDDTVMALSIVDTLRLHGTIEQDQLAQRFAKRYASDPLRGYGGVAHAILQSIRDGHSWREVACAVFGGTGSKGNGGAMRAAPIGGFAEDSPNLAAQQAILSAAVTHAHPEGQAGAAAVAVAASVVNSAATPADVFDAVLAHTPAGATRSVIARAAKLPLDSDVHTAVRALGNGSRTLSEDTVPFSLWCLAKSLDSYVDAMWLTASGFGDCDTNCAIVGGVLALRASAGSIPPQWLASREPLGALPGL